MPGRHPLRIQTPWRNMLHPYLANYCFMWTSRKALAGCRARSGLMALLCMAAVFMQVTSASPSGRAPPLAQMLKENPDLVRYWTPLQEYLSRYGYLSVSNIGAVNLQAEDQLRQSIKRMQKFGSIEPTGHVDGPTLNLLQKRRCGIPDLIGSSERVKRYAIQGQKWKKTNLTWSIKDWASNVDSRMVKEELTKAFKVWSDASMLNFEEVRRADADIVISFLYGDHGDGYSFDGKGIVLAHAFFPGDGIGGDAHFDAEEPWFPGEPPPGTDGVSLFAVAAHEFGHSLGLTHSSVAGSLMNPFYQSIKDNFQLPHDDTLGIQVLYGARNPTKWAPLPPYSPTVTTTRKPHVTGRTRRPATTRATRKPPTGHHTPRPTNVAPETTPSSKPNTCKTTFDSISMIRRELFIFKGKYFWRLNSQGLMKDYPVEIQRFWHEFDLEKVDAVYERPIDTKIVFFSGNQYWLFNGNTKERGYPRPLTDLGLPEELDHIDAAMVWGYNGKTYLFSGSQYWRYDESEGRVELDYPRDMAMWRGVPYEIDAAFQHTNGQTYFFKGENFWQFNDFQMKVHQKVPGNVNKHWFGCPTRTEQTPSIDERRDDNNDKRENSGSRINKEIAISNIALFVLAIMYAYLQQLPCL